MALKPSLVSSRPKLFSPSSKEENQTTFISKKSLNDLGDTNIESNNSFRYEPIGSPLKSSQQLNVDWSKFENHCFFSSGEVLVNISFDKIINEYPFDGTKKQLEEFLDSLSGFENWVLSQFPKNKGYLFFSGTQVDEDPAHSFSQKLGTHIVVNDFAGSEFSTLSRKRDASHILDPEFKSFSTEFHLFVPAQTNDNQIIFQKLSGSNQGITLALSQSSSTSTCNLLFGACSASLAISSSAELTKGKFNHIYTEFNRGTSNNNLKLFINRNLIASSSNIADFGLIDFKTSPLVIGSGSVHSLIGGADVDTGEEVSFIPTQTLSGALDEFRIFHGTRSEKQLELFEKKNIFTSPELKLYFKFNEPSGSIGPETKVLDSSGNSLHSEISNYVHTLRETGSISVPTTFEKLENNPVLFPAFPDVRTLNSKLLVSASDYDEKNPNLITRLIPPFYFEEGQFFEGLQEEEGTIGDSFGGAGIPGTGKLGTAQLLSQFLYVFAKHFDEIKIFIDHFGDILFVNYDDKNSVSDQLLPFLAEQYGFKIPSLFREATPEQFLSAENINFDVSTNSLSLQFVQNQIWRRVLTNIQEIISSKGTIHSVKTLFRTMGINPDSNFRIREFGGPTERQLTQTREDRSEISFLIDFSGSIAPVSATLDRQGIPDNIPFIISPYLSSSRIEIGFPEAAGTFVNQKFHPPHGISNNVNDGLLTSGSWTYEAIYRFPNLLTGSYSTTLSLARLNITGTSAPSSTGALVTNLIAVSGSATGSLKCFVRPSIEATNAPTLELLLTGVNIFDGDKWNVSFGRQRNDEINSKVSSSYFLRAGKSINGNVNQYFSTSSFFMEDRTNTISNNSFQNISTTFNTSGSFITIGSQSIGTSTNRFLNDTSNVSNNEVRATKFEGKIGHIRFWSKALTENEFKEHIRNFKSVGVSNPIINFNFERSLSGSFERLRIDASGDQQITASNSSGKIDIFDFSQNEFHLTGSGFEFSKSIIKPEDFQYSVLSAKFDEYATTNKVRVRGFLEQSNIEEFGGQQAPVHQIDRSEIPQDDTRFSIEFGIINALNDDIIKIFGTFDELENALGSPEIMFSPDYVDLEKMRQIYFNRLTDKINLKEFFSFFKWFDSFVNFSEMITSFLNRKTRFFGINMVIESHVLERARIQYFFNEQYLKPEKIVIEEKKIQTLEGLVKKY